MSILDDAIREHLELKRQHGADDSELKQLEDEAFGPAERPSAEQALPDPLAQAPTARTPPPPPRRPGPGPNPGAGSPRRRRRPRERARGGPLPGSPTYRRR